MQRSNHGTVFVFALLFLSLGIIAPLITFKTARERSGHAQAAEDSRSIGNSRETKLRGESKNAPNGMRARAVSWQTGAMSKSLFETENSSLLPKIFDPVRTMLLASAENPEDRDERQARADQPDEAARFRSLQMQDENGEIPIDGLQKAREQMDRMRALYRKRAKAAGKPGGIEVAGLAPGDWTWLGPGNVGGRVRSIVTDPTNANNLLVGSVSGGIWRSTDTGNSWQVINDFMANLAVSTMVRNPFFRNDIYAGTGESFTSDFSATFSSSKLRGAGVFKSTDGGLTWNQLASTNPASPAVCPAAGPACPWSYVNRLAISPDGTTILAATINGIYRSNNGGSSWTAGAGASGAVFDIDFDPTNSLLAVAGGAGAAAFSVDGGQNWSNATFTAPPNPAPTPVSGRVELAYAPSNPLIVYASVDQNQGEVYRSVNGGQTYALVNTGSNLLNTQGGYDNIIWVNPLDPTFVIVGGVALWRSTDSAQNFTQISRNDTSSAHPDHHMIVASAGFNNSSDKSVYFGNDGGVFRADDVSTVEQTMGWTHRNNNLGITQFYGGAVAADGTVFGGTQDNGNVLVRPTPNVNPPYNPQSWHRFVGGDGGYVAADPSDANYLYSEYTNLQIQRSTDGGNSSSYIYCNPAPTNPNGGPCTGTGILDTASANFIAPFVLDPNNANTMLAGGLSLWRSTDIKSAGIPSWTAIKAPDVVGINPIPISAIAVSPINSDMIVVGHNNGDVFITSNGTSVSPSWSQINIFPIIVAARFITRLTIDATRSPAWIYATMGGFKNDNIYVTKDLGASWTDVSGTTGTATDLPAVPVRSLVINRADNNKIYVGTEVGIFASEDAGANWQLPQGGPANVSVDELFWYQGDLFAATHGRGVYKTLVPVVSASVCIPFPYQNPPISCTLPATYCPASNGGAGGCCEVGSWDCPCSWGSRVVPNQNLDVDVACPITASNGGTARNMYVGNRLTINGPTITVFENVTNAGLIDSTAGGAGLTTKNLVNYGGTIFINDRLRVSGDIANYGVISGAPIEVEKPLAPPTSLHRVSGSGFWGNSFLRIFQTAELGSNVTLDTASTFVNASKLKFNNFSLTVKGDFSTGAELDLGSGNLNLRGNTSSLAGDVKGTGTINLNPASGTAGFSAFPPAVFQPSLHVLSGTINASLAGSFGGPWIVDPGAVFNVNGTIFNLNGDLTVNGALVKNNSFGSSEMNFNGATLTNNGSMFVDFLYFNNTNAPRTQSINGNGTFGGMAMQIGLNGSPSTTTLTGTPTFNQGQFGIGSGSTLTIGNGSTARFTGSNFTNAGNVSGPGTLLIQPAGTATLSSTGGSLFQSPVIVGSGTVTPSLRATGPFTVAAGATLSGGSLIFYGNTFTNNGAVASTGLTFDGLNFQPVSQQLGGTGTFTGSFGQFYIAPRSTTTLLNNVTYSDSRIYNEGLINTGAFTLTLPCPTGSEGPGEIIGNVRRTNLASCIGPIAFGSPFTTIQFTSGTPPTEISVNVALNTPPGFPNAVQRTYLITPVGGSNYLANLRLHYLDSELNGNDESALQLFRNNGTNWIAQGATGRNTIDNWVEYSGVSQFSPWALAPLAPTAARVSVGGRVFSSGGIGVTNALVVLTGPAGQTRSARTNPFGYYRLDDVPAGETYVVTVLHKEFSFASQAVSVTDAITNLNFMSEP